MHDMNVSPDDAAAIYARACQAWYGRRALSVVTSKVHQLQQRGDTGGVAAWARVAVALSQSKKHHRGRSDYALGRLY
jgi:hypothetical protein